MQQDHTEGNSGYGLVPDGINVNTDPWRHMASPGNNELTIFSRIASQKNVG